MTPNHQSLHPETQPAKASSTLRQKFRPLAWFRRSISNLVLSVSLSTLAISLQVQKSPHAGSETVTTSENRQVFNQNFVKSIKKYRKGIHQLSQKTNSTLLSPGDTIRTVINFLCDSEFQIPHQFSNIPDSVVNTDNWVHSLDSLAHGVIQAAPMLFSNETDSNKQIIFTLVEIIKAIEHRNETLRYVVTTGKQREEEVQLMNDKREQQCQNSGEKLIAIAAHVGAITGNTALQDSSFLSVNLGPYHNVVIWKYQGDSILIDADVGTPFAYGFDPQNASGMLTLAQVMNDTNLVRQFPYKGGALTNQSMSRYQEYYDIDTNQLSFFSLPAVNSDWNSTWHVTQGSQLIVEQINGFAFVNPAQIPASQLDTLSLYFATQDSNLYQPVVNILADHWNVPLATAIYWFDNYPLKAGDRSRDFDNPNPLEVRYILPAHNGLTLGDSGDVKIPLFVSGASSDGVIAFTDTILAPGTHQFSLFSNNSNVFSQSPVLTDGELNHGNETGVLGSTTGESEIRFIINPQYYSLHDVSFLQRVFTNSCYQYSVDTLRTNTLISHMEGQFSLRESIQVYPQPVSDELYIDISPALRNSVSQVGFYDVHGRLVQKASIDKIMNVKGIPNGIYFLSFLNSQDTVIHTSKIVIQH